MCNIADYFAILGVIITAIALIVAIRNFRKQLQLNFFAEYTKRYQDIILNFPENINEEDFRFEKLSPDVRDKTLRYMRAYFDLCSEEYFLWTNKNIDNKTWKEWEEGMRFAYSKTAFKEAWKALTKDTIYYGEFSEFVKNSMN